MTAESGRPAGAAEAAGRPVRAPPRSGAAAGPRRTCSCCPTACCSSASSCCRRSTASGSACTTTTTCCRTSPGSACRTTPTCSSPAPATSTTSGTAWGDRHLHRVQRAVPGRAARCGVALLLNRAFPGRTFFRAVFFTPYVLGVAVVGVLFRFLLDPNIGVVNHYLHTLGISRNIPWTTQLPWAWVSLVAMTVWWTLGLQRDHLPGRPAGHLPRALRGRRHRRRRRLAEVPQRHAARAAAGACCSSSP